MTDDEAIEVVQFLRAERSIQSSSEARDQAEALGRVLELAREAARLRALLTEPSDEMIKAAAAVICGPDPEEFAGLTEDERAAYILCARAALRAAGQVVLGGDDAS